MNTKSEKKSSQASKTDKIKTKKKRNIPLREPEREKTSNIDNKKGNNYRKSGTGNNGKALISQRKNKTGVKKVEASTKLKIKKLPKNKNNQSAQVEKKTSKSSSKQLRIIPLGGLDEIGKNMTAYEYGNDIIVVDCGMGFPEEDMFGVDVVIPDITYLKENKDKIRGLFITHGHEDHIGAIPYFIKDINIPIYATALTNGLIEIKLEERNELNTTQIFTKKAGDKVRLGCFEVEFIHVNHSISDAVAFAIKTPLGTIIHTGDFKIDVSPVNGEMMDLTRLGELGREGVLALLSDSTNVEKEGHTDSERKVKEGFNKIFIGCDKRIIVTTFASNVDRIQQIIDLAVQYHRKVAVTGRSLQNILRVATVLGYMSIPEDCLIDISKAHYYPDNQICIISTGSQGENMSALYRMAYSSHKQVDIGPNDRIIISASAIPGNETMISHVIDELVQKGAEVVYDKRTNLHVSGHASQEDQKMIIALVKPKYFIPIHGEHRMLVRHRELALSMGVEPKNSVIASNGNVIKITDKTIRIQESVKSGAIMVDNTGTEEVGKDVLTEKHRLAADGIVIVSATISTNKELLDGPSILTKGFIYDNKESGIIQEMKYIVMDAIEGHFTQNNVNKRALSETIVDDLANYLNRNLSSRPIIIPIITEITI
jgi:ribonuclease J